MGTASHRQAGKCGEHSRQQPRIHFKFQGYRTN
jgi:hypothetical protein